MVMNIITRKFLLLGLAIITLEFFLYTFIDKPLADAMRDLNITHPQIVEFFRSITDIAKAKWYLPPSAIGIFLCAIFLRLPRFKDSKKRILCSTIGYNLLVLFANVALSGIITNIIKRLIGRARPILFERDGIYGFDPINFSSVWHSMPSGHATTAISLALCLTLFFPRWKIIIWLCALTLVASRIIVTAHYMSDVIAGTCVAIVTAAFLQQCIHRYGMFHVKHRIFPIDKTTPMN